MRRGLRLKITVLATVLAAVVSTVLLCLGWLIVGEVLVRGPVLPPGTTVEIAGEQVQPDQLAPALRDLAHEQLLDIGLVAFLVGVIATGLVAWLLTGRVLRPLHEVTHTARRLSAESLSERIPVREAAGQHGPQDEVAELTDTFNGMLQRLESAFNAQQRFVANASHELRTPLAVVRTELDVTLADPEADTQELRRMATVVLDATERAERLVDSLLILASASNLQLIAEPVDLAVMVNRAWHAIESEAKADGLEVSMFLQPACTMGDPALLERVAGNLLENAVRHNLPGGQIEVHTFVDGGVSVLLVSAAGNEIPADKLPQLFEPFRRGGVDRTARRGTGLGLSIVAAAVDAHEGEVTARLREGGGLITEVRLPCLQQPVDQPTVISLGGSTPVSK
ncbi:HAMP domain-containing protein [Pseudonocardiaceae bacterium YIM PH 21723]|nr:HAMP domain-containing protein [Pseudonocardiaceae bacterium YIM PH 21723]